MPGLSTLGDRQQQLLKTLLTQPSGLTVDQLADQLEISRNAVNQHISNLKNDELIDGEVVPSTRGRPSRIYKLSERGQELFPRRYDMFSNLLLGMVRERIGSSELRACMKMLGQQLAQQFVQRVQSQSDLKHRFEEAANILHELGYEATHSTGVASNGDFEIIAKNCVFHKLAEESEEVCQLDISLLSTLLENPVELRECMVRGGNSCRFGFAGEGAVDKNDLSEPAKGSL